MIATRKKLYPAVLAVLQQPENISRCMDDGEDQRKLAVALTEAFADIVYHPDNQEPTRKLRNEYKAMADNLAAVQHRSSQLLLALRAAWGPATGHNAPNPNLTDAIRAVLLGCDWKEP